jgi:hypothetical protein
LVCWNYLVGSVASGCREFQEIAFYFFEAVTCDPSIFLITFVETNDRVLSLPRHVVGNV